MEDEKLKSLHQKRTGWLTRNDNRQAGEFYGMPSLREREREAVLADLIVCLSAAVLKKLTDDFFSARGKAIHIMTQLPDRPENLRDVFEPRSNVESCRNCLAMMRPALDNMAEKMKE